MPSDWMRDDDPRVRDPKGEAGGGSETGRVGEDFRGVGEDADELLEDQDFPDLGDGDEDDDAL